MRMRRKKWARPELSVCPYFMKDPSKNRGHWAEQFERPEQPFWLELGCGKGTYAARVAADHPEINLLAIDIKSDILAVARRNIQAVYAEAGRPVDNLRLTAYEIGIIHTLLAPEDTVDRICINFCNIIDDFHTNCIEIVICIRIKFSLPYMPKLMSYRIQVLSICYIFKM